MAIRNIVLEDEDILRKKCRPVEKFDKKLWTLLDDMAETMAEQNGAGLAAPQVGILRRAVVVDTGEQVVELINPEIIEKNGEQEEVEGCLSIPGTWGITCRPFSVTVKAQDRNGDFFTISGEGLTARAFCHELDHLDGILFIDHVIEFIDPSELD